ncbi:MAG: hypothetical protein FWG32_09545, partial [Oscillospiraceae bacterium]|nr:hypothetical protein [Oscillospiraceae bacterium]
MSKKSCIVNRSVHRRSSLVLSLIMLLTLLPAAPAAAADTGIDYGDLTVDLPVLVVSGSELISGGVYTAANISNEKSYTLTELQAMYDITDTCLYSSLNSSGTKRIYIGEGVYVSELLALSGHTVDNGSNLTFTASDGYTVSFNNDVPLNEGRKYFPNIGAVADEDADSENAPAILAWATGYIPAPGSNPAVTTAENPLRLLAGQTAIDNVNNGLFNQRENTIQAGDA